MSAAFAYYTLQSIFPLLLIALAVAARVYGKASGVDEVVAGISPLLPPSVVKLVETTLMGLVAQGVGAGLLGIMVLLVTASNVYLTLQRGADRLWSDVVAPRSDEGMDQQIFDFIKARAEAYLVVLVVAALIVVEQVIVGISRLPIEILESLRSLMPSLSGFVDQKHLFTFGSVLLAGLWLSLLAYLLQRVLLRQRIPWRSLIPGSVMIGYALSALNSILSLSIVSLGSRFQAYGVIGGVLVLTLWVWMVGIIIYYGQCVSVELVSSRLKSIRRGEPNLVQA
ncbi:YihY/virulence factor BrkB family protein [Synechococcus sp. KORDI-100]|uniref:YihY/virulence factor BrkB family protein n=1 Tax=Synechococcus sp. KORDI-100 TaxID=1280380 RepID=UPI001EF4A437|nr:YihY/virulence factor BrkB family protein [Synechococcus sp. KORDI-100]